MFQYSALHILFLYLKNQAQTEHVFIHFQPCTHHWLLDGIGLDIPSKLLSQSLSMLSALWPSRTLLQLTSTSKWYAKESVDRSGPVKMSFRSSAQKCQNSSSNRERCKCPVAESFWMSFISSTTSQLRVYQFFMMESLSLVTLFKHKTIACTTDSGLVVNFLVSCRSCEICFSQVAGRCK